jgi:YVTN family beta-propeller protein/autotransporter-associated beta strand protein
MRLGTESGGRRFAGVWQAGRYASLAAIVLAWMVGGRPATAQTGPFGYISDSNGNVSVVDVSTDSVAVGAITAANPRGIAVRGDGSLAYVASYTGGVSVVDTATNSVIANISTASSIGIAINSTGTTVYAATNAGVSVINTATNTVTQTIPVGSNPWGIAVSPNGNFVYVSNSNDNTVSVISTASNTVVQTVNVGSLPENITLSPDGTRLYVINGSNNVSVVSTVTNTVTATITIPGATPFGMAVSPDGTKLYVTNSSGNTVSVINTSTNTIIGTITTGSGASSVFFSPDGTRLYVTNETGNTISVIDTATNTVINTVAAGNSPGYSGICSNGNALLASGLTFKANSSGALACTQTSGVSGPVFTGGTMQFAAAGITSSLPIMLMSQGGTFDTDGNNTTLSGTISGPGGLTKIGLGTLTLSGSGTYTGPTAVNVGTLQAGAANAFSPNSAYKIASGAVLDLNGFSQGIGSLAGSGSVTLGVATLTTGNDGTTTVFSGSISGTGGLAKIGAGTLILTGTNSYSGTTTINGGTLEVDGSITNSSNVTVNSGGTLNGIGIVDPATTTIMSGGTLAPGNAANPTGTLAITGNLAFQSGAIYLVQVTPSVAASTNVSGTATLGGATVNAFYANGSYISKQYTILTAGGVSGTFSSLVNNNLPANFTTSLSYDPTHAFLNLALNFTSGPNFSSGLNVNQQNVANTLTNFFNATGGIPMVFGTLTPSGLTQASGELATGSQQATFDAMNLFMGLMTDPFVAGRGDGAASGAGGPTGYASTQTTGAPRDAYAMFTKAPPAAFEQHWSVWAAGYGGSQTTDGNASLGSNSTTSSIAGTAVGADYRISPNTIAGFALAGGGTSFSVAGSGSGRSDLFQAGAFIRHTVGPAYISGALAYGWQDITTNRTVTVAGIDQLRAEFNANAFSGRLEGGYRFVSPWAGGIGLTPYAAAQFTTFDLPAYAEQATVGSNAFALAYNAKDVTDTRSELGIRTDKSYAIQGAILTLRGRFAWAHDFDPDRSIAATFQTLPGASFTVNGAAQAHDSALTTASVEMKWINGWSAAATFEGEFSNVTSSYAGKGVVRYTW